MYDIALSAWRSGQIAKAERHCRVALARSPNHIDALYLSNLIAFANGRAVKPKASLHDLLARDKNLPRILDFASALRGQRRVEDERAALHRALALDPNLAAAHFHLANTFTSEDPTQAEAHLCRAIELQPQFVEAYNNLGNLLRKTRPNEAQTAFERAAETRPDFMLAHFNLGTLLALSQPVAAETALRRALRLTPAFAPAWNALGNLLSGIRPVEAEEALRQAIEIDPSLTVAWFNLGNLLYDSRPKEAIAAWRHTVTLKPDFVPAWINLSHALSKAAPAQAESAARQAIALAPQVADAHYNLGTLLLHAHPEEAVVALRRTVALQPDHVDGWYQLGNLLAFNVSPEAEAALRRAIELKPDHSDAYAALGLLLFNLGRLDESVASYRRALAYEPGNIGAHNGLIFTLPFQADDPQTSLQECLRYVERHEIPLIGAGSTQKYENDLEPERRLRIGYVSPDFRAHSQSLFTVPLLAHHDHEAFEIICYSSVTRPDSVTTRLRNLADVWRDVQTLDDAALAQQIRADRVDILVDLTMHMPGSRRLVFAWQPAPVQVAWLAYPGTTGSPAMGYRFTDRWLDPSDEPGRDALYTERSLRLPDAFWCYDAQAPGVAVNTLPAASNAPLTFGCLNNPAKIGSHTLRLWSAVLTAVPQSRLFVLKPRGVSSGEIAARYAAHGVDPSRVVFNDLKPRRPYLEMWQHVDVGLDSFPSNGHTTSLDAFWMGVPVVTRTGQSAISRGGLSIACNLGLPDLVAYTDEEYVRIAAGLAQDLPHLARLRAELRQRMESSPLMDAPRFAANIEGAYRRMWREHCEKARER